MSDVDGLGSYLLCCLGFVFGALVEFTIITMLKQKRTSHKDSSSAIKSIKPKDKMKIGIQPGKFAALKAAAAPYKRSIQLQINNIGNNDGMEEVDLAFLRKIDFNSFIAYLIGFILFNSLYWVDMIYG